jgi:LmbE family N-acetylglucosaminyl deacetylase
MTDDQQLDVVAVGAHPDDLEIGCGGTLARLVQLGYRVGMIDLTDGEPTPLSSGPEERLREAEAARVALGVHLRVTLALPNRRLFDSHEARLALATEFRRFRPRLVIGIAGRTPMASPDHWQAAQIIDAAVFYSRLTKWDDQFAALPPHRIGRQLYCHLSFEPAGDSFGWPLVQDISLTLPAKLSAIRCYASQFPPAKAQLFARVEALALAVGHAAGFGAGERFWSMQSWGTNDLVTAGLPGRAD